ncbi:MAG: diphthamide synthesis protein [Candidatus Woesearchaeota archaeon]|nr:diphthamide synthesis protein [Candidatus Woesearchaeota archaeon]
MEVSSTYNLDLEKAASEIKKAGAKKVCIQLPDGLKPKAKEIADFLKEKTKAEIFIWLGSCFGACDIPNFSSMSKKDRPDILIQWGHSKFI